MTVINIFKHVDQNTARYKFEARDEKKMHLGPRSIMDVHVTSVLMVFHVTHVSISIVI